MAVSKEKTGVLVNMDKTIKEELSKLAKEQNRSLSNLIVTILKKYVDSADKQSALYYLFNFHSITSNSFNKHSSQSSSPPYL